MKNSRFGGKSHETFLVAKEAKKISRLTSFLCLHCPKAKPKHLRRLTSAPLEHARWEFCGKSSPASSSARKEIFATLFSLEGGKALLLINRRSPIIILKRWRWNIHVCLLWRWKNACWARKTQARKQKHWCECKLARNEAANGIAQTIRRTPLSNKPSVGRMFSRRKMNGCWYNKQIDNGRWRWEMRHDTVVSGSANSKTLRARKRVHGSRWRQAMRS